MKYDFEESVGVWLTLAHQSYSRAIAERLLPHGITFRQAQVLGFLELDGPQTQSELAGKMMIEPPSLVGVLNRMERSGLVERQCCPDDRRCNSIHLLPSAEALWQQVAECARQVRTAAVRGMSGAEIAQLKRLLTKVNENVSDF
ncbi:MarR family winged helix-turn-helix transcriptional regulator [Adhaeretor mobilis]|uniref:Transcriptional regulator SlyA n=1 Tax=Adhaeretor mobilis TaxID=1930276 RepID=A0A517MW87_9BACT|nr:MarR family transcriptional regulator [Adhaeretor mobilis]QDS99146.1 Transcriptional regulator SlyA [Adhaeretor mobilis]